MGTKIVLQTHYQELNLMNKQEYNRLLKNFRNGKIEVLQGNRLKEENGKLYIEKKEKLLRILLENEIESVLYMTHDHPTGGHLGRDAVYNKIKERFYWKGMKEDIENYIRTYEKCQRRGGITNRTYLNPIKVKQAFDTIGIDFVGPLNRTRKGNKYILVLTEYLTKWPEAKALKEATAEKVAEFLYKEIICRHGCPRKIISDRGSHFVNEVIMRLCDEFQIKHAKSSPYHPQTNGLTERFNRTLCESLAKLSEEEKQWDEFIEPVLFAYRTTKHSTTKFTPFYLMNGKEANLPIDEINKEDITNERLELMKRMYQLIELEQIFYYHKRIKNKDTIRRLKILNLILEIKFY